MPQDSLLLFCCKGYLSGSFEYIFFCLKNPPDVPNFCDERHKSCSAYKFLVSQTGHFFQNVYWGGNPQIEEPAIKKWTTVIFWGKGCWRLKLSSVLYEDTRGWSPKFSYSRITGDEQGMCNSSYSSRFQGGKLSADGTEVKEAELLVCWQMCKSKIRFLHIWSLTL